MTDLLPATNSADLSVPPVTPEASGLPVTPAPPKVSLTARETKSDWKLLGRTQGQRGAEVFAAGRAKFDPSLEHSALSRAGAESLVSAHITDPRIIAFFIARPRLFQGLIERELAHVEAPVIIEMAAGFLPRGLIMAREHPTWTVIEIDLPDVMEEKRFRFENHGIAIPPNLTFKSADLGVTPLKDVLGDQRAHIVTAEGLMMYFEAEDQKTAIGYVLDCLQPGGKIIFDLNWVGAVNDTVTNVPSLAIFRQSGNFTAGLVENEDDVKNRFGSLGYQSITVFRPSQLEAEMPQLPSMTHDGVLIVVADKSAQAIDKSGLTQDAKDALIPGPSPEGKGSPAAISQEVPLLKDAESPGDAQRSGGKIVGSA